MDLIAELTAPATGGGGDVLVAFLKVYGAVIALMAALYVGVGLFFTVTNARRPDRKIQKTRVNGETRREILRAPASLATLAFYFSVGIFAQIQGWTLAPAAFSWWSWPLLLVVSLLLYDAWFYWAHRLLHWKPMWRFHALHHKSITPTVWSNHSESFVEASLLHLYYAIVPFLLPIPWQMLLVQKIYDQVTGMVGHAGYEHFASPMSRIPWPLAGTVFHDQHHSSFKANYGHTFSLWDRLMGTLHPRYDSTVAAFEGPAPAAGDPQTTARER
ncbi:MAG TPA: sterol desaturase family protein [Methylomirabilota bacterium]|nr:sterol desaturase family protein [Methylomirabilota bacterium]